METNNEIEQIIKPRSTYPTWGDLLAIVGVLVAASIVGGIAMTIIQMTGGASQGFAVFVSYILQFSIAIAFALWHKWRRGGERPLLRISLKGASPSIILWGVILTAATSMIIEPIINLFPANYLETLNEIIGTGGWAMVTTIVCAPIMEEILFRGIIQNSATQRWGEFRGILIASVIFGAIHLIPPQAINAFFVSLVLGYIYIKSGSLIAVIVIHAINNAIAYFGMILTNGKIESTQQMIGNDKIYYIIYGISVVIFAIAIFNVTRRLLSADKRKQVPPDSGN